MSGWTAAAMVGQTSGVPLNIPVDGNIYVSKDSFLPGCYSIGEILENHGYQNELLIGSDGEFGGREYYFKQHGNFNVVDYDSAIKMVGLIKTTMFGGVMKILNCLNLRKQNLQL